MLNVIINSVVEKEYLKLSFEFIVKRLQIKLVEATRKHAYTLADKNRNVIV